MTKYPLHVQLPPNTQGRDFVTGDLHGQTDDLYGDTGGWLRDANNKSYGNLYQTFLQLNDTYPEGL